ncbi:helix-turn-helix domain-containing protein [Nonomuraea thailandensis]
MPSNIGEGGGVRSVQRAFGILSLLSEDRRTLTIREVVDETGLAKTTALRLLQSLEHMGLLWATPQGFAAGPALWRWAHLARSAWELPPETVQLMRELGRGTGRPSTSTCRATCAASASPSRRARNRCATWCASVTSCPCGPAPPRRCC